MNDEELFPPYVGTAFGFIFHTNLESFRPRKNGFRASIYS